MAVPTCDVLPIIELKNKTKDESVNISGKCAFVRSEQKTLKDTTMKEICIRDKTGF